MSIPIEVVIADNHCAEAYRTAMTLRNLTVLVALAALPASANEHDFDFAAGSFRSQVRRLQKPLTGSTTWVAAKGEVRTRKVLNGLAEVEQADRDQPARHLREVNLHRGNPRTRQGS